jgi:hypothetical protein
MGGGAGFVMITARLLAAIPPPKRAPRVDGMLKPTRAVAACRGARFGLPDRYTKV